VSRGGGTFASHRQSAKYENVEFLIANGMTEEDACKPEGVERSKCPAG
jgi:hypothetical protein